MKRYVVVGCSRSGTTVTHKAIFGHPQVSALTDEILIDPFFIKGLATFTHGRDTELEKNGGHRAIFDAITSINANNNTEYIGLKTSLYYYPEYAQYFTTVIKKYFPAIKVIITYRDDNVAQYGSWIRARITGQYHSWNRKSGFLQQPLKLNKYQYIKQLLDNLDFMAELATLKDSHDVLEFSFEDDICEGKFYKLFDFLALPACKIDWLDAKKVAPPPQDYIKNYASLMDLTNRIKQQYYNGNRSDLKKYYRIRKQVNFYNNLKRKMKAIFKILHKKG